MTTTDDDRRWVELRCHIGRTLYLPERRDRLLLERSTIRHSAVSANAVLARLRDELRDEDGCCTDCGDDGSASEECRYCTVWRFIAVSPPLKDGECVYCWAVARDNAGACPVHTPAAPQAEAAEIGTLRRQIAEAELNATRDDDPKQAKTMTNTDLPIPSLFDAVADGSEALRIVSSQAKRGDVDLAAIAIEASRIADLLDASRGVLARRPTAGATDGQEQAGLSMNEPEYETLAALRQARMWLADVSDSDMWRRFSVTKEQALSYLDVYLSRGVRQDLSPCAEDPRNS